MLIVSVVFEMSKNKIYPFLSSELFIKSYLKQHLTPATGLRSNIFSGAVSVCTILSSREEEKRNTEEM